MHRGPNFEDESLSGTAAAAMGNKGKPTALRALAYDATFFGFRLARLTEILLRWGRRGILIAFSRCDDKSKAAACFSPVVIWLHCVERSSTAYNSFVPKDPHAKRPGLPCRMHVVSFSGSKYKGTSFARGCLHVASSWKIRATVSR